MAINVRDYADGDGTGSVVGAGSTVISPSTAAFDILRVFIDNPLVNSFWITSPPPASGVFSGPDNRAPVVIAGYSEFV
jgi:hypothetical protein